MLPLLFPLPWLELSVLFESLVAVPPLFAAAPAPSPAYAELLSVFAVEPLSAAAEELSAFAALLS